MPIYTCKLCDFSTKIKSHNKRHLNTKKHKNNINNLASKTQNEHKMSTNEHKMSTNEHEMSTKISESSKKSGKLVVFSNKIYECQYCENRFTTIPNKRRHELHYCKKNVNLSLVKDETIKNTINVMVSKHEKEKKQLYKQIEKLIDKAGNTNTVNIQANTHNTQNIKLNSYGKEDLSHITDIFKTNLLKIPHGMIPKMIEAVHFNDNKPENKNIQFTNKRDNKIKVFSNDKWVHKSKDETIHDLMDGKYFILDTHYSKMIHNDENENQSKTLNIMDFYEKFRQLFDERDNKLIEDQRKECELVLLNNR